MSVQTTNCGGCGLLIFRDDEARAIAHEDPECAQFAALLTARPADEVRDVRPEVLGAHMAALAARTRGRDVAFASAELDALASVSPSADPEGNGCQWGAFGCQRIAAHVLHLRGRERAQRMCSRCAALFDSTLTVHQANRQRIPALCAADFVSREPMPGAAP
jgi:hypothetical protein